MGFFKSLTSQVGRDTGRVISNKVWGDKHASVYRRAQDHYKEKQQAEEQEALNRMIAQQRIEKIQNVTESNLANIISMKVPQQKEELVEMLQQLLVMLIANPWGSIFKVDCKITNKYSDAILVKYEQVIFTFKMKYPAELDISYYEKQLDDLKKTRKKSKYTEVVVISVIGVVFAIIVGIMAYNESNEKETHPSLFKKIESVMKKSAS